MKIFSGSSHKDLADNIAKELQISVSKAKCHKFSNDNIMVMIGENVREKDIFLIQTSSHHVNDAIMEMLIFIDALKFSSAARITAVIPYFPYCRSDKKDQPRISIAARLIADLIQTAGANRVLTMDLHAPQIQGFFRIPVDQLLAAPVIFEYLQNDLFKKENKEDFAILMGDAGAAKQFAYYGDELKLPVSLINKIRPDHTEKPIIKNVIGDVESKKVLMVDDEIASGGTIIESVKFLKATYGATKIYATAIHPVFSGDAVKKLYDSDIEKIIVTDTIPVREKIEPYKDKFVVLSVAPLFAKAINCIHNGDSMSNLFPESVRRKVQQ